MPSVTCSQFEAAVKHHVLNTILNTRKRGKSFALDVFMKVKLYPHYNFVSRHSIQINVLSPLAYIECVVFRKLLLFVYRLQEPECSLCRQAFRDFLSTCSTNELRTIVTDPNPTIIALECRRYKEFPLTR